MAAAVSASSARARSMVALGAVRPWLLSWAASCSALRAVVAEHPRTRAAVGRSPAAAGLASLARAPW